MSDTFPYEYPGTLKVWDPMDPTKQTWIPIGGAGTEGEPDAHLVATLLVRDRPRSQRLEPTVRRSRPGTLHITLRRGHSGHHASISGRDA